MAGMGLGPGQGQGDRPEERPGARFYDTQVKADPKGGKAVVVGVVRGPNVAGDARVEIQEEIEAFKTNTGDPLTGKRLPKAQEDHVLEYMNSVRRPE